MDLGMTDDKKAADPNAPKMRVEWRPDEHDGAQKRARGLVESGEVFPWLVTRLPDGRETATRITPEDAIAMGAGDPLQPHDV